jgi:hypothetical protein
MLNAYDNIHSGVSEEEEELGLDLSMHNETTLHRRLSKVKDQKLELEMGVEQIMAQIIERRAQRRAECALKLSSPLTPAADTSATSTVKGGKSYKEIGRVEHNGEMDELDTHRHSKREGDIHAITYTHAMSTPAPTPVPSPSPPPTPIPIPNSIPSLPMSTLDWGFEWFTDDLPEESNEDPVGPRVQEEIDLEVGPQIERMPEPNIKAPTKFRRHIVMMDMSEYEPNVAQLMI